jgi:hypothetical protein
MDTPGVEERAMPKQKSHAVPLLAGLFVCAANLSAQTTRPEAEKNLARDIYKEFVEIQSGYTTGSTTPLPKPRQLACEPRDSGIPTYGIQGFFIDRDDIRFHGRDERMSVQSFYEGQAFLYELVKILSRKED